MKVAVIGAGAVAEQCHLPALVPLVGRDAIFLVDPDPARRDRLVKRFRLPRQDTASADDLPALDAAVVAVPNDLHASVAARLLDAGVPVLCEKPLAATLAEAEGLAERAGPLLAVAHVRRFFPSVRLLRELLAAQELGAPLRFELEEGSPHGWSSASAYWLDRRRAGGGVLVDIGSHVLDLVRFWLGDLEVRGYADDAHGGVEANARVELAAGGVPGTVELSRTRTLRGTIRVTCEHGTIEAPTGHHGEVRIAPDGGAERRIAPEPASPDGGYGAAFRAQLEDFLRAVREGSAPEVPAAQAVPTIAAIEACYAVRSPLAEPWVTELLPR